MATIRRHPVPADSYEPNRPLSDLGRDQLKHFIHVAQQLPPRFRLVAAPPSPEDSPACTRYIAAVTENLMAMRKAGLTLVSKKPRKPRGGDLAIAAAASTPKARKAPTTRKAPARKRAKASRAKPRGGKP